MGSGVSVSLSCIQEQGAALPTRIQSTLKSLTQAEQRVQPKRTNTDLLPPTPDELLNNTVKLVLSELSTQFPEAAPVFTALNLFYGIWQSGENKSRWVAHFMVYLKSVEAEVIQAAQVTIQKESIERLSAHLEIASEEFEIILARNSFLSLIFAAQDSAWLETERATIETLKSACVSALVVDIATDLQQTHQLAQSLQQQLISGKPDEHIIRINPTASNPIIPSSLLSPTSPKPTSEEKKDDGVSTKPPVKKEPVTSFRLLHGATLESSVKSYEGLFSTVGLGSVASVLEQFAKFYDMWSAGTNKVKWLADFYVQLQTLELQISQGQALFRGEAYLDVISKSLKSAEEKVKTISTRTPFIGRIMSLSDRSDLESIIKNIQEQQQKALFAQFTSLASMTHTVEKDVLELQHTLELQEHQHQEEQFRVIKQKQEEDLLAQLLTPIDQWSEVETERKKYCIGTRVQILSEIGDWLRPPKSAANKSSKHNAGPIASDSRVYWLAADPGLGKSILSCVLLDSFPKQILAAHFCKHDQELRKSPSRAIKNLAWQLTRQLPAYRQSLLEQLPTMENLLPTATAKELWNLLLVQPIATMDTRATDLNDDEIDPATTSTAKSVASSTSSIHEKVVLLIDGLDECSDARGTNPFLQLLSSELGKLPSWLCFFITSVPDPAIQRVLGRYGCRQLTCDQPENRADVLLYLRQSINNLLPAPKVTLGSGVSLSLESEAEAAKALEAGIQTLATKAGGMLIYAKFLVDALADLIQNRTSSGMIDRSALLQSSDFDRLPTGLSAFYLEQLQQLKHILSPEFIQRHPWLQTWSIAHPAHTRISSASESKEEKESEEPISVTFLRTLLELTLASFEPLSLESLTTIIGAPTLDELKLLLESLCTGSLFRLVEHTDINERRRLELELAHRRDLYSQDHPVDPTEFTRTFLSFSVFHKSVRDWLVDEVRKEDPDEAAFFIDLSYGHARLREICWQTLLLPSTTSTKAHWHDATHMAAATAAAIKKSVPALASIVNKKLWPVPPPLRMDELAHPDQEYLYPSSLLSYSLRFGPKHCLAAGGSGTPSKLNSFSLVFGGFSFQTLFPFLPAAQFLCHLGYLHARAAQDHMHNIALEYAEAETSAQEWERAMGLIDSDATSNSKPSTPSQLTFLPPSSGTALPTHEQSWMWLRDGMRASEAIRNFQSFIQLELNNWRGHGSVWEVKLKGQQTLSTSSSLHHLVDDSKVSSLLFDETDFIDLDDDAPSAAIHPNSYEVAKSQLDLLRTAPIAAQLIYASADTFPSGSPIDVIGVRPFDAWFRQWSGRRVRRVIWKNKPQALPNLLASLSHVPNTTGDATATSSMNNFTIHALAFSPDSSRIASICSLDRCIRIFHAVSYELIQIILPTFTPSKSIPSGTAAAATITPNHLCWLHDSTHIACGGYRAPLQIFDVNSGEPLFQPIGDVTRGIESAKFTLNDAFVFIVGYSKEITLYHVVTGQLLRTFGSGVNKPDVHFSRVHSLETNFDHTLLISYGWDEYLVGWSLGTLEEQDAAAKSAMLDSFDPDREVLNSWVKRISPVGIFIPPVSAGHRHAAKEVAAAPICINSVATHPTQPHLFISASTDAYGHGLCSWNLHPNYLQVSPLHAIVQKPEQHAEEFTHLRFTPSGEHLFAAAKHSTAVSVFEVSLVCDRDQVVCMEFEFVGMCDVGQVASSNITTMSFSRPKRKNPHPTASVDHHPTIPTNSLDDELALTNIFLLTGDSDGTASIWDLEKLLSHSHQELAAITPREHVRIELDEEYGLEPHQHPGSTVDASFPRIANITANERFIVLADSATTLYVYFILNGKHLRTIVNTNQPIFKDPTLVDSASDSGLIEGDSVKFMTLASHRNHNDPDLLVASYQRTHGIKLWNVARGLLLRIIGGQLTSISPQAIAFNPLSAFNLQLSTAQIEQKESSPSDVPTGGAFQLLAHDGLYPNLWDVSLATTKTMTSRIIFQRPPKAPFTSEQQREDTIVGLDFHPTILRIATIDTTGTVRMWSPKDAPTTDQRPFSAANSSLAWDHRTGICWSYLITNYGLKTKLSPIMLTCCQFSPVSHHLLAVGGLNHCFTLFDADANEPKIIWKSSGGDTLSMAWHPSGRYLATVDRRHTISIWDIQSQQLHIQYFNQPIGSDLRSVQSTSSNNHDMVYVTFPTSHELLFYHSSENCVKLWSLNWIRHDEKKESASHRSGGPSTTSLQPSTISSTLTAASSSTSSSSSSTAASTPLSSLAIHFNCDRLSSLITPTTSLIQQLVHD